jgi:hypothetical protein
MDLGGPSNVGKGSKKRLCTGRKVRHMQKKRLHILANKELKAFTGWEAAPKPWTFPQCAKYIGWCHVGHMWPYSRYAQCRRDNRANLHYCTNEVFKERCIQVSQFIYDEAKVNRNEVNFSILRMVYAEVVLGVPVDWRTMEIQTNSKMTPLNALTVPYARKFPGEGLGKKATEVEIPNNKLEWSRTSSDDSDTGCDPHVRKEIYHSFKYGGVEDAINREPSISTKDDKEGDALEKDAVYDEGVKKKPNICGGWLRKPGHLS